MYRSQFEKIKNLHGAMFKNNKKAEKQPEFFGYLKIQKKVYDISGWVNEKGNITLRAKIFDETFIKDDTANYKEINGEQE